MKGIISKSAGAGRKSNLELLRIISMLLIVLSHYCTHNVSFEAQKITVQSVFNVIFTAGGIGVICFVMISAYFLLDSQTAKPRKVVSIWAACEIISIVITAIFYCADPAEVGIKTLIKSFFAVTYTQWWFATAYLLLYLLTPYLNRFIRSLEKNTYEKLLLLLFAFWGIIPTVLNSDFGANDLVRFVCIYLAVGYLKQYPPVNEKRLGKLLLLAGGVWIVASVTVLQLLGQKISAFWWLSGYFNAWSKLPQLMVSAGLFLLFKNAELNCNSGINRIASATFYVYLIHDHPLVRQWLWQDVFNSSRYQQSGFYFIHCIIAVAAVYMVCTLLGLVYQVTLERLALRIYDKLAPGFGKKWNKLLSWGAKGLKKFY